MSIYDQIEEARLAHIRRQYQDNHREYYRHPAPAPRATRRLLARCLLLAAVGALGFYAVSEFSESGSHGFLSSGGSDAKSGERNVADSEAAAIDSVMKDPERYIKPE